MKTETVAKSSVMDKTETPRMYAVLLHNDDYTSQDYVVRLLMSVFGKSLDDAHALMLRVHLSDGAVTVGSYTHDIAKSKKAQADRLSEEHGFPLFITVEPEGYEA